MKPLVIFETVSGSQLYGTALPTSDTDFRGVVIEPMESLLGFHKFEEKVILNEVEDRTHFSLRKFLSLALDANPNILELLYAPRDKMTVCTPLWERVLEYRQYFLSQKVRKTFVGYAYAQLKKMETHHRWLTSDPPTQPNPEKYGQFQNELGETKWTDHTLFQQYQEKKKLWENYQTWLANRNPDRAELEKKYGFDCKFGMHTIRLLRMGYEILTKQTLTLPRPDAKDLLDIRNGKYSYEELVKLAEDLMKVIDSTESLLPEKPNYGIIESLCISIHMELIAKGYGREYAIIEKH